MSVAYDNYESSTISTKLPLPLTLTSSSPTTTTTAITASTSPIQTQSIINTTANSSMTSLSISTNTQLLELLFGHDNKELFIEHITHDKQRKEDILSDDDEMEGIKELKLQHNPILANYRFQDAVPLSLSGMAGGYGQLINGIYIPTSQFEDNWPVYKKVPQNENNQHNNDMFLCFQAFYKRKHKNSSTNISNSNVNNLDNINSMTTSSAWIIKNHLGKVYARIVLNVDNKIDLDSNKFAIEKLQFTEKGKRKDIQWEMRSSVGVLGFRKRPGGVIRPASMIQLKLLPEQKTESLELCHQISPDNQQVNIYISIFLLLFIILIFLYYY